MQSRRSALANRTCRKSSAGFMEKTTFHSRERWSRTTEEMSAGEIALKTAGGDSRIVQSELYLRVHMHAFGLRKVFRQVVLVIG